MSNPLLTLIRTDVYKLSHALQYCPGTSKVYSYLIARSNKTFQDTAFFGLQYYLREYLMKPITKDHVAEFIRVHTKVIGPPSQELVSKMYALAELGYWPIKIKAVPEGTVVPVKNALMTMTNTHPDFAWCVGFIESLVLKVWYTTSVATTSLQYKRVISRFWSETVSESYMPFMDYFVHDFGYRGDTSEEGAAISGVGHLLSFKGSDTLVALPCAEDYYGATDADAIMSSVPASEHSVMCSYGRDNELAAFERMLELYPEGIVSIVSDTFNIYTVLTDFMPRLKAKILARNGKCVLRPDSGNPEYIICGDPSAPEGSPEWKGAIRLLDEVFGHTVNDKGYKVINERVGLIYGDGMYLERYERTLQRLKELGYAASNLCIGVGGILRNHSRDTGGFALKATYVIVNGEDREIEKDPITDPGKRSHKGLIRLDCENGEWKTVDQVSSEEEERGMLQTVFIDGTLYAPTTLREMRARVAEALQPKVAVANGC